MSRIGESTPNRTYMSHIIRYHSDVVRDFDWAIFTDCQQPIHSNVIMTIITHGAPHGELISFGSDASKKSSHLHYVP